METNNIEMITKMVIDAINKNEDKGNGFVVPIGVSARHIHLTQEHVEALFGEGPISRRLERLFVPVVA